MLELTCKVENDAKLGKLWVNKFLGKKLGKFSPPLRKASFLSFFFLFVIRIICSGQSWLQSFPTLSSSQKGLRSGPSCPLEPLYPHPKETCMTLMYIVHIVCCIQMYTFMRICWPVWCASMAKPVGPSHPLDATETELDCLRTVDTCTNSMILNCLCLPFPPSS